MPNLNFSMQTLVFTQRPWIFFRIYLHSTLNTKGMNQEPPPPTRGKITRILRHFTSSTYAIYTADPSQTRILAKGLKGLMNI